MGKNKIKQTVQSLARIVVEEYVVLKKPLAIGDGSVIRSHSVLYGNTRIGKNFQTGHGVLIRDHCAIGDNVSVGSHTVVEHHVVIGSYSRVHSNAFIPEFTKIGENCWIGPSVVLTNAKYPHNSHTKRKLAGVTIQKGAIIGAGSVILPGVTIGENALIGAGSVVTKDVPSRHVVVGNPHRKVNILTHIKDYEEI